MAKRQQDPSADELQKGIETTRRQLGETLGALQARFQPQQLMEQVRDSVRDGVREAANGATEQLLGTAREKAEEVRNSLLDAVRSTPLAGALISMGMSWLLSQGTQHMRAQAEDTARHTQESLQHAAADAQERVQARASELGDAAREQLKQVEAWLQRATGGAPLALGAIALAAGVILGFALPATQQERELLGEVRETLIRQARELGQDAGERAQRVGQEARGATERAARDQGLIH